MKKILIIISIIFVASCGEKNYVESSPKIPISCKNPKAIEFYNKAELKKSRGDIIGSISDYKACLENRSLFLWLPYISLLQITI